MVLMPYQWLESIGQRSRSYQGPIWNGWKIHIYRYSNSQSYWRSSRVKMGRSYSHLPPMAKGRGLEGLLSTIPFPLPVPRTGAKIVVPGDPACPFYIHLPRSSPANRPGRNDQAHPSGRQTKSKRSFKW